MGEDPITPVGHRGALWEPHHQDPSQRKAHAARGNRGRNRGGRSRVRPPPEERRVIVEPTYRGYRIEAEAVAADDRWNADVRMLRLFSREKPRHEIVTCYKLSAEHAERAAEVWARRWIDL